MLDQIKGLHHVTSMASDARGRTTRSSPTRSACAGSRRRSISTRPTSTTSTTATRPARPGSVMTYFPFPNIGARPRRRRRGRHAPSSRCRRASLGFWRERLAAQGVTGLAEDRQLRRDAADLRRARRRRLRAGRGRGRPARRWTERRRSGRRTRSAASTRRLAAAARRRRHRGAAELHGLRARSSSDGEVTRLASTRSGNGADVIDLEALPGARRARPGAGSVHHVAFAVADRAAQLAGAQGADGHRLPGDAGDRPRLFLGDLLPHARRRAVRGRHQRAGLRPRRGRRASRRGAEAAAAARASARMARRATWSRSA